MLHIKKYTSNSKFSTVYIDIKMFVFKIRSYYLFQNMKNAKRIEILVKCLTNHTYSFHTNRKKLQLVYLKDILCFLLRKIFPI